MIPVYEPLIGKKESTSQSTRTGLRLLYMQARAQETMVNVGIITSLPDGKSKALRANIKASVPLLTTMPYFIPT
ncbi:hypothetical protein ES703_104290 [subsurface metagenome]